MTLINGTNIEHTQGDTFKLEIAPFDNEEFEDGSTLQFLIAKNEKSNAIINKSVALLEHIFTVEISSEETKCLELEDYIYKAIVHSPKGGTLTQISGDFIVKWGA